MLFTTRHSRSSATTEKECVSYRLTNWSHNSYDSADVRRCTTRVKIGLKSYRQYQLRKHKQAQRTVCVPHAWPMMFS